MNDFTVVKLLKTNQNACGINILTALYDDLSAFNNFIKLNENDYTAIAYIADALNNVMNLSLKTKQNKEILT